MIKNSLYLSAAFALVGLLSPTQASASSFIFDNTANTSQGNATVGFTPQFVIPNVITIPASYQRRAESFTTSAFSYSLDSIDIKLLGTSIAATDYTVSLWSNNGGTQHPNAQVLSFNTTAFNNGAATLINFTPSVSFTLNPSTKYWIVTEALGTTKFSAATVSSSGGNSTDVESNSTGVFTGAWGNQSSLAVSSRVSATVVPEPASFAAIAGLGCAGLFLLRRRQTA